MRRMSSDLTFLHQQLSVDHWRTLADIAQDWPQPLTVLWDPWQMFPVRGLLRHAERIYAVKIHRHALTPLDIWLGHPQSSDQSCPACQTGSPYTPSRWAVWDSPYVFDHSSDAVHAVGTYIRQHAGWHNADSLARAWRLPVTANLVRGVDNYTLGHIFHALKHEADLVIHRHVHQVDGYERTVTWMIRRADSLVSTCPDCRSETGSAYCLRCGARIASELDVIDQVQGLHGTKALTVWHLDPPGCIACVPTGWTR